VFLWFLRFFLFFVFFAYSQGNEDLTVWGLILSEVGDYWPFVLQCWGSPLFIFAVRSFLWRRSCFGLRGTDFNFYRFNFCSVALLLMASIFLDPEACEFYFAVQLSFSMASIFRTLRHASLFLTVWIPF
jgi:hypothetical protein